MTLLSIILLLPVFFAIHELEEIIMMQRWVSKNRSTLYDRYPKIGFIIRLMEKVNTRGITIIAAEEFVIVSACTFATAYTGNIVAWYCCLAAFGIHLVIHLFQFITWRRYIPAIVTSLLCLPYCIYAIYRISGLDPVIVSDRAKVLLSIYRQMSWICTYSAKDQVCELKELATGELAAQIS